MGGRSFQTALLILSLSFGATDPVFATVVSRVSRSYPGYSLATVWQIGCATTRDFPSPESQQASRADQERRALRTRRASF